MATATEPTAESQIAAVESRLAEVISHAHGQPVINTCLTSKGTFDVKLDVGFTWAELKALEQDFKVVEVYPTVQNADPMSRGVVGEAALGVVLEWL